MTGQHPATAMLGCCLPCHCRHLCRPHHPHRHTHTATPKCMPSVSPVYSPCCCVSGVAPGLRSRSRDMTPATLICRPRTHPSLMPCPAALICRPHAGPSLMPCSHGWLSSFAGHAPAHPLHPPIHLSYHTHMPGCLHLHASHAPTPLSPPGRLHLQVTCPPVSHTRLHNMSRNNILSDNRMQVFLESTSHRFC